MDRLTGEKPARRAWMGDVARVVVVLSYIVPAFLWDRRIEFRPETGVQYILWSVFLFACVFFTALMGWLIWKEHTDPR